MRADFRILENGDYYAKRVIPLRHDGDAVRDLAYAQTNAQTSSDEDVASVASAQSESQTGALVAQATGTSDEADHSAAVPAATAAEPTKEVPPAPETSPSSDNAGDHVTQPASTTELPHTASAQPLIALLGMFSIAAAGTVYFFRRRRHI